MNIEHLIEPKIKDLEKEIDRLRSHLNKVLYTEDPAMQMMRNSLEQAEYSSQNKPAYQSQFNQTIKRHDGIYSVVIQIVRIQP